MRCSSACKLVSIAMSAPPSICRATLALAARLQSSHGRRTDRERVRSPWPDRGARGGGGSRRGRPAGARRTACGPARAPGSRAFGVPRRGAARRRGEDRLPRADRAAARARRRARHRHRPRRAAGGRRGSAGGLRPSRVDQGVDRARVGRCPGQAAGRRSRRRRRPARRAVPVEPAAAARPPLGPRHEAAEEPARALLAPRGRAHRPARLAARARDRGALPRSRRSLRSSTATSWPPHAGSSRRPVRCCTCTPMPPPCARSSGAA